MKPQEVKIIISETQDNDALINRSSMEDKLSDFLEGAIDAAALANANGIVDLEQLETDYAYAISEIKKAKDAVAIMIERNSHMSGGV